MAKQCTDALNYRAVWHDRAAILARLKTEDDEENAFEIADRHPSVRSFPTSDAAVAFLKTMIAEGKDFFGQGEVREIVKMCAKCSACVCRGYQCTRIMIVDDDGVADDRALQSECL